MKINKNKTKKIVKEQAEAKTHITHPDGHTEEKVEKVGEVQTFTQPTANINVNAGRRMTDNNYGSFSVGVSLTLPCIVDAAEIEETYIQARDWVDAKLSEMIEEVGS